MGWPNKGWPDVTLKSDRHILFAHRGMSWLGQNNSGQPIGVIYYGLYGWPSRGVWYIPGTLGYDEVLIHEPAHP